MMHSGRALHTTQQRARLSAARRGSDHSSRPTSQLPLRWHPQGRDPGGGAPPGCQARTGRWGGRCTGGAGRAAPWCRPARGGPCPGRRKPLVYTGGHCVGCECGLRRGDFKGQVACLAGAVQCRSGSRARLPEVQAIWGCLLVVRRTAVACGSLAPRPPAPPPHLPAVGAGGVGQGLRAVGALRHQSG